MKRFYSDFLKFKNNITYAYISFKYKEKKLIKINCNIMQRDLSKK